MHATTAPQLLVHPPPTSFATATPLQHLQSTPQQRPQPQSPQVYSMRGGGATTATVQQASPGFQFPQLQVQQPRLEVRFRTRSGRLDWASIASVDPARVLREGDVNTLRALVDNITFSNVELEANAPSGLVKVVQLSQLMIEFFHTLYQQVETHCNSLQVRLSAVTEERDLLRSHLTTRTDELNMIKREARQLKKTASALQMALDMSNNDGAPLTMLASGTVWKCPLCKKIFKTGDFLESHVNRRHPLETNNPAVRALLEQRSTQRKNCYPPVVMTSVPPITPQTPSTPQMGTEATQKRVEDEMKLLHQHISEMAEKLKQSFGAELTQERELFTQRALKLQEDVTTIQREMQRSLCDVRVEIARKSQQEQLAMGKQASLQRAYEKSGIIGIDSDPDIKQPSVMTRHIQVSRAQENVLLQPEGTSQDKFETPLEEMRKSMRNSQPHTTEIIDNEGEEMDSGSPHSFPVEPIEQVSLQDEYPSTEKTQQWFADKSTQEEDNVPTYGSDVQDNVQDPDSQPIPEDTTATVRRPTDTGFVLLKTRPYLKTQYHHSEAGIAIKRDSVQAQLMAVIRSMNPLDPELQFLKDEELETLQQFITAKRSSVLSDERLHWIEQVDELVSKHYKPLFIPAENHTTLKRSLKHSTMPKKLSNLSRSQAKSNKKQRPIPSSSTTKSNRKSATLPPLVGRNNAIPSQKDRNSPLKQGPPLSNSTNIRHPQKPVGSTFGTVEERKKDSSNAQQPVAPKIFSHTGPIQVKSVFSLSKDASGDSSQEEQKDSVSVLGDADVNPSSDDLQNQTLPASVSNFVENSNSGSDQDQEHASDRDHSDSQLQAQMHSHSDSEPSQSQEKGFTRQHKGVRKRSNTAPKQPAKTSSTTPKVTFARQRSGSVPSKGAPTPEDSSEEAVPPLVPPIPAQPNSVMTPAPVAQLNQTVAPVTNTSGTTSPTKSMTAGLKSLMKKVSRFPFGKKKDTQTATTTSTSPTGVTPPTTGTPSAPLGGVTTAVNSGTPVTAGSVQGSASGVGTVNATSGNGSGDSDSGFGGYAGSSGSQHHSRSSSGNASPSHQDNLEILDDVPDAENQSESEFASHQGTEQDVLGSEHEGSGSHHSQSNDGGDNDQIGDSLDGLNPQNTTLTQNTTDIEVLSVQSVTGSGHSDSQIRQGGGRSGSGSASNVYNNNDNDNDNNPGLQSINSDEDASASAQPSRGNASSPKNYDDWDDT
ncbi:zinc finger protein [Pelomyxa schiedti]|nr:zinc finger protein [Pelomyxa schiedti]